MQSNGQQKEFRIRTVREVLEEDAEKKAKQVQVKKGNKPKETVAELEASAAAEPPALSNVDDELVFEI